MTCPPMSATLPTVVHVRFVEQSMDSSILMFAAPPEGVGSLMVVGAWSADTAPIESTAIVESLSVPLS